MGKTVRQLLQETDSQELSEWMAYAQLEPFGEHLGDIRAGTISATIANCNLKKGSRPFKPSDFVPKYGPPVVQTVEQIKKMMLGLVEETSSRK